MGSPPWGRALCFRPPDPLRRPRRPRVIDCHHHFVSPAFLKALTAKEGHKVDGFTSFFPLGLWKNYSPAKDIETMDRDGVATSLISCTAPGVWFGDPDEARGLARELNEYGAKMASDYKGRYGLLAVLPIPRVDESLKEIEYAFDTLKADGVGVLTSYGNHWLGDPAFQPIFDELNRRKAVVYTHPIDAPCCQDLMQGVNPTTLEYPTDTARAILSLLGTNAATRYGDIRFIFSHAGGTMPSVIDRIGVGNPDTIAANLRGTPEPNSRLYHLRRFYYDTAQSHQHGPDAGAEDHRRRIANRFRNRLPVRRNCRETGAGAAPSAVSIPTSSRASTWATRSGCFRSTKADRPTCRGAAIDYTQ